MRANVAVAHRVASWNQNGALVCPAMSLTEQMLIVNKCERDAELLGQCARGVDLAVGVACRSAHRGDRDRH